MEKIEFVVSCAECKLLVISVVGCDESKEFRFVDKVHQVHSSIHDYRYKGYMMYIKPHTELDNIGIC